MSFSLKIYQSVLAVVFLEFVAQTFAEFCTTHGHSCKAPQQCCGTTCCLPEGYDDHYHRGGFEWSVMNMWYFWFIVIFILMSCFGGCGYWRRRQLLIAQHQQSMAYHGHIEGFLGGTGRRYRRSCPTVVSVPVYPYESSVSSNIPGPPPPSAASDAPVQAMFPCPPPYSEVVSKPDVYLPSKEELPPYPGEPVITADDQDPTSVPAQPVSSLAASAEVPGLPPYSLTDPSMARQHTAASTGNQLSLPSAQEHLASQHDEQSAPISPRNCSAGVQCSMTADEPENDGSITVMPQGAAASPP